MNAVKLSQFTPPSLPADEEPPVGEVCYENIGPRERQKRALYGYLALGFGVALAAGLVVMGADRWWRLLVFGPLAAGVANWLQARERT